MCCLIVSNNPIYFKLYILAVEVESVGLGHDPGCAVFLLWFFFVEVKGFGIGT